MIRTSLSLAMLVVLAASAAQAAPSGPRIHESIPVNKVYEITHPGDKVGPQIDPSGPLHRAEPDPDPWYEQYTEVVKLPAPGQVFQGH